jgi:hypothetical protein
MMSLFQQALTQNLALKTSIAVTLFALGTQSRISTINSLTQGWTVSPMSISNELFDNSFDSFSTQQEVKETLASKYDEITTQEVAQQQQQQHLAQRQREELGSVLIDFTKLFSGKLDCYPHAKVQLELLPEANERKHALLLNLKYCSFMQFFTIRSEKFLFLLYNILNSQTHKIQSKDSFNH